MNKSGQVQDPETKARHLAYVKQQVQGKLRRIIAGLEAGSLEVEMYHDNKSMGHAEVNVILKGDYLGSSHRVHLVTSEDWATHF